MRVVFIGESDNFGCINGKIYEVIAEEKNFYRIIDETGEDYLYMKKNFTVAQTGVNEESKVIFG